MNPQVAEAARIGNAVRAERARQRQALADAPKAKLAPAIIHPTPELAKYKLETLFGATARGHRFHRIGPRKLEKALARVEQRAVRQNWHSGLRLGELTERERRWLVRELLR